MKLAEALIERANLQKRIVEVKGRIQRIAVTQKGTSIPEDPEYLLEQLDEMYDRLIWLIGRINLTNGRTQFDSERTLAEALAQRDVSGLRHAHFRDIGLDGVVNPRVGRSEIKFESNIDSSAILQKADEFARLRRELDVRIQELNWTTELVVGSN